MIAVSGAEACRYWRTECMSVVRDQLMQMQTKTVPDELQLPSLSVALVRTGDLLYIPPGFVILEKCVNDMGLAVRTPGSYHQSFRGPFTSHFMFNDVSCRLPGSMGGICLMPAMPQPATWPSRFS